MRIFSLIKLSIKCLALMMILTGMIYPLLIMLIGNIFFPYEATGSLIKHNNQIIGSELVGQQFTSAQYFWGRPSAGNYHAAPSSASNLGPTSAILRDRVQEQKHKLRWIHHADVKEIPADLLFSSGSGVDPHISIDAALFQVSRISQTRKLTGQQQQEVFALIKKHTEQRQFFILGEKRINVLQLNLEMDAHFGK